MNLSIISNFSKNVWKSVQKKASSISGPSNSSLSVLTDLPSFVATEISFYIFSVEPSIFWNSRKDTFFSSSIAGDKAISKSMTSFS